VKEVTTTWPDVAPGTYVVQAVVDPEATTSEGNEDNNQAHGAVLVAKGQIFLPLVVRHG
jgi:subtilase family serine protease